MSIYRRDRELSEAGNYVAFVWDGGRLLQVPITCTDAKSFQGVAETFLRLFPNVGAVEIYTDEEMMQDSEGLARFIDDALWMHLNPESTKVTLASKVLTNAYGLSLKDAYTIVNELGRKIAEGLDRQGMHEALLSEYRSLAARSSAIKPEEGSHELLT